MTLETGSRLTLNALTNNGVIRLNSSVAGFASLILNSYTRGAGGTEEIQLYLSGGGNELDDNFKWHYISTPVSSLDVSIFAPGTTYNLAQCWPFLIGLSRSCEQENATRKPIFDPTHQRRETAVGVSRAEIYVTV
jgi:hypothetical protein